MAVLVVPLHFTLPGVELLIAQGSVYPSVSIAPGHVTYDAGRRRVWVKYCVPLRFPKGGGAYRL